VSALYLVAFLICELLYLAAPKRGDIWYRPQVRVFVHGWEFKNGMYYYGPMGISPEWRVADFTTRFEFGAPILIEYKAKG